MEVDYVSFRRRDDRAHYLVRQYGDALTRRVVDVGCDTGRLRTLIPEADYLGIDIHDQADVQADLEQVDRLPVGDGEADCVVCTDVLEHLDNLHAMFDELVRIARGRIVISLPNCWTALRKPMRRGRGTPKFYGLPASRPADRHKWFFNVADVIAFMQAQAARHDLTIVSHRVNIEARVRYLAPALRAVHRNRMCYLNRYAHSVWTCLERR